MHALGIIALAERLTLMPSIHRLISTGVALFQVAIAGLKSIVDVEGVAMEEWQNLMMIKGELEFEVLLYRYTRGSLTDKEPTVGLLKAIER